MAYDEVLEARVRSALPDGLTVQGKRMFGGMGFMLNGNMACGIIQDTLIVRVGPESYEQALAERHVKEFDMTGRPMQGWVQVEQAGIAGDEALHRWVMKGFDFAGSLPPKL